MAGPAMVRGEALAGEAAVEHRTIGAWRGGADDRGAKWSQVERVTSCDMLVTATQEPSDHGHLAVQRPGTATGTHPGTPRGTSADY